MKNQKTQIGQEMGKVILLDQEEKTKTGSPKKLPKPRNAQGPQNIVYFLKKNDEGLSFSRETKLNLDDK